MAQGYGRSVWCDENGVATSRYVGGPLAVAQSILRRLTTTPGTLRGSDEALNFGFSASDYIGAHGYDTAADALPALIRNQCLQDDRVISVAVNVEVSRDDPGPGLTSLTVRVDANLEDPGSNFSLTLSVTEAATEIRQFEGT